MAFDLDNEELRATRRLHGINDGLYEGTIDKNVANDSVIAHKFAIMQQQINEKDKRIQELEEESRKKSIELICYQEELENSISTQVVIDKIKELDIAILECEYDDDDVEEYKNDVEKEKRILLIKKSALEELLEEK